MTVETIEQDRIVGHWASRPVWEQLSFVEFRADGSGRIACGGGQSIHLELDFRYLLDSDRAVQIEYLPTTRPYGRWQLDSTFASRSLSYQIARGNFVFPFSDRPVTYDRRLYFSDSPLPLNAKQFFLGGPYWGREAENFDRQDFVDYYTRSA